MSGKGIVKSFIESILTPEARDTAIDWAELGLDAVLNNELVKEIPIVKTMLAVRSGILGLREQHLVQKITYFLTALEDVSEDDKKAFLQKLSVDDKYATRVFENLLLLLDRLDDVEKSLIVGELFKSMIYGLVSVDEFKKLSSIIERAYLYDLKVFLKLPVNTTSLKFSKPKEFTPEVLKHLAALGLLNELIEANNLIHQAHHGGSPPPRYHFEYVCSDLGATLLTVCEPLKTQRSEA